MGVREFYGGDIAGVMQKLDYLQKLGIIVWFNTAAYTNTVIITHNLPTVDFKIIFHFLCAKLYCALIVIKKPVIGSFFHKLPVIATDKVNLINIFPGYRKAIYRMEGDGKMDFNVRFDKMSKAILPVHSHLVLMVSCKTEFHH